MSSTTRGISLNRQASGLAYVPNRGEGFRLRITATNAVNMPAEIFLHQRTVLDPHTNELAEEFLCICSCFDLTIYPANAPDPQQFPQFYRTDTIDIVVASQAMAEEAWTAIYEEVCTLVESLNKLDRLSLEESVRCGAAIVAPDTSESISLTV